MEKKIKHLEFIQSVINRMAHNSFLVKGWFIAIITALTTISLNTQTMSYLCASYLIVVIFWFLDSYYLKQEKLFRDLYNEVRQLNEETIDFSMQTNKYNKNFVVVLFSKTIFPFYLGTIGIITLFYHLI